MARETACAVRMCGKTLGVVWSRGSKFVIDDDIGEGFTLTLVCAQTDIKGRVQLDKIEEFMKGLKASRSRTLSLGLMR